MLADGEVSWAKAEWLGRWESESEAGECSAASVTISGTEYLILFASVFDRPPRTSCWLNSARRWAALLRR